MKTIIVLSLAMFLSCSKQPEPAWEQLLNDEQLSQWHYDGGTWFTAGDVSIDPDKKNLLKPQDGPHIIAINGPDGRTTNLFSNLLHGDCRLHVEFMLPHGSNSGVYLMGRYEVQIFDSWGTENPAHSDCGGIYQRWKDGTGYEGHPPQVNAGLPPGEWQSFDIQFRAPRFDENGEKIQNAEFVKVVHNGKIVHENVRLTGPTRAAAFEDEQSGGPLMLQGDHGPVAFRNIRIKRLD